MMRRLVALAAALSLLLCLAMVALWVRSETTRDSVWSGHSTAWGGVLWRLHSAGGRVSYEYATFDNEGRPRPPSRREVVFDIQPIRGSCTAENRSLEQSYRQRSGLAAGGFGLVWRHRSPPWTTRLAVMTPYWFFVLLTLPAPSLWAARYFRRRRDQRRSAAGRCPACGYDLRATQGRCPECGAAALPGTMQSA